MSCLHIKRVFKQKPSFSMLFPLLVEPILIFVDYPFQMMEN